VKKRAGWIAEQRRNSAVCGGRKLDEKEADVMGPVTRLVLGLVVLIGIMAAVALGLPAYVTVSRSVEINAPEHVIYPYLSNLHRFIAWSSWAARDPNMKVTYSGPEEGRGAKVEWVSEQPSIGTGSVEIVGTDPSKSMDLMMNLNGLEGTSSYELAPSGAGSKVTWSFGYETGSSPLNFWVKRWKGLMLDGLVGAEYRAGLERLKAEVEADRKPISPAVAPTSQGGGASTEVEESVAPLTPGETVVPQSPAQGAQVAPPSTPDATPPEPKPGPKRHRTHR
jgi:hypothetical protein